MDLINKEVSHKVFGKGQIIGLTETAIEIAFGDETKKFMFPDAFGKFLKLHDEKAAESIKEIIAEKEKEREEKERKLEEERERERQKQQLRAEHEKLMKNHKLHPESQAVFWYDEEEDENLFTDWQVFTGVIKSGKNQGTPRKLSRLQPNSACLLTERDADEPEENRRIIGAYMVSQDFIGKLHEDGYIPSHPEYRIKLTEEEANKLKFWNYYINEKHPDKTTWNTGKYRYFDNMWMAQILVDIVDLKTDPEEKELAQEFLDYFCKMNQIIIDEIPKPSGALLQESAQA